jgi:hypothetical protein
VFGIPAGVVGVCCHTTQVTERKIQKTQRVFRANVFRDVLPVASQRQWTRWQKHGINRRGHKMSSGPRDWRKELESIQQRDPVTGFTNYGTPKWDIRTHTLKHTHKLNKDEGTYVKAATLRDGPETENLEEMGNINGEDMSGDVSSPFVSNSLTPRAALRGSN